MSEEIKTNKINKRIVYQIEIQLKSPLCVSSGKEEKTDLDVQRDYDGIPFVPGTSLAGAMRHYVHIVCPDGVDLFGREGDVKTKTESWMSPLFVSELFFDGKVETEIRDGVRLKEKVAVPEGKYEREILEPGAKGWFRIELTIREQDQEKEEKWMEVLQMIWGGIQNGDIHFGANKTRGLGKMEILHLYKKEFCKRNVDQWLAYENGNIEGWEEQAGKLSQMESKIFWRFCADLCLRGGISIRKYSIISKETNFEQLHRTRGGEEFPIIPGTSWAGAIRSRAQEILEELFREETEGKKKAETYIRKWFGWVETEKTGGKSQKSAKQSMVTIEESEVKGVEKLFVTRNKINRFDASTVEGALYTEKTYSSGKTRLEIKVRKSEEEERKALCGLLLLVIKDIQLGYLAVGGGTAVGRGIFKGDQGAVVEEEQTYMKALYKLVKGDVK